MSCRNVRRPDHTINSEWCSFLKGQPKIIQELTLRLKAASIGSHSAGGHLWALLLGLRLESGTHRKVWAPVFRAARVVYWAAGFMLAGS